ncbi:hypothetical protein JZ751_004141 [Albula glossodonta]|uniref:Uncharacterized protein n=1 Tax=Albula glossodonta TaxID=121402 RepID=A0A8T2PA74_9TELE|nr:hypothetical protein JZ751_004141 [Albula glossodonta]
MTTASCPDVSHPEMVHHFQTLSTSPSQAHPLLKISTLALTNPESATFISKRATAPRCSPGQACDSMDQIHADVLKRAELLHASRKQSQQECGPGRTAGPLRQTVRASRLGCQRGSLCHRPAVLRASGE